MTAADRPQTLAPPDSAILTRTKHIRRRRKIIQPGLQIKIGVIFALVLISTLGFFAARLHVLVANQSGAGGAQAGFDFGTLLRSELLVAAAMGVALTLGVAVAVTFRIAGPVYRMSQFLKGVRDGSQTEACRLRKGDAFGDLCTLVNEVTQARRQQNETTADSHHEPAADVEPEEARPVEAATS